MKAGQFPRLGLLISMLCIIQFGMLLGESGPEKTLSPYFLIESDDPELDQLPLKSTTVDIQINGVIANVRVKQQYCNTGALPIHAKYVFPASTNAAVHGMQMTIGDHVIKAKIKEKVEAQKTYDAAKKAGKSASLLKQHRPNVFSMNVANIMSGDTIDVELKYTELLTPTNGTYEFVYPTVVGPRYSNQPSQNVSDDDKWVKSPYFEAGRMPSYTFQLKGMISTGIPIQEMNCTSHKTRFEWMDSAHAKIHLDSSEQAGGNRDFILKYRLQDKKILSGLMLFEGKEENFFLLMVQPPDRITTQIIPPREYIFIMDVSGSMSGYPINTSKQLMRDLISNMREQDKFNLMLFAGSSHLLAPKSLPATQENMDKAILTIDNQRGGGGTEMLRAIKKAMAIPVDENYSRNLIVATDGYVAFEDDMFHHIRNNLNQANFYAFGIGSSVNRYLIEGIAKAGQGEEFIVTNSSDARHQAIRMRQYIQFPVLTNINIEFEGFETYDVEPVSCPDLLAKRPIIVFGKYKGKPTGIINISGFTGDGKYSKTIKVDEWKAAPEHEALRYLWARKRISLLSDFGTIDADKSTKEQIVELGLRYNLLTKHTSFIAVHEKIRNPRGKGKNINQPLPLPQGVPNSAVGGGYATMAEPELWSLICMIAIIGSIVLMRRYQLRKKSV